MHFCRIEKTCDNHIGQDVNVMKISDLFILCKGNAIYLHTKQIEHYLF